ncbi:MAG: peptidase M24 [Nitrospirales bacterium]|nr:MAG: peptidase M24 [Nitrospirales bacterium]
MSKKFLVILVALVLMTTYLVIVGLSRWGDITPPEILITQPFDQVGPSTPLSIRISDPDTGLRHISIRIVHNLKTYVLDKQSFSSHGLLSAEGGTRHDYELTVTPYEDETIPRKPGDAKLVITARDYSWRNLLEGNRHRITQDFTPKFSPPRLELLSPPSSIAQGGSGVVRYRASPDAVTHGVKIQSAFFPGYPMPDDSGMFALIAMPYNAKSNTPIQLTAQDAVGNTAILDVDLRVKKKAWRTRRIGISDSFIEKTVLPIIAQTPELPEQSTNLENFVMVNNQLRQINNQTIRDFSKQSEAAFLWTKAFRQLPGSKVEASFADHRNYVYKNKVVDTQDHLGFDLAVTKHYPVQASNDGVVLFAGYLGIYGNTIIIDHGYGLQSLYAHLSSFSVKTGDAVLIGQIIARSGTTGLAAGDHLHFSLVLHGEQVNPTEWWDANWVQTRIRDKLSLEAPPEIILEPEQPEPSNALGPRPGLNPPPATP